jgi:hypothetical protein
MKKALILLIVLMLTASVTAVEKNLFSKATVKTRLDIPVLVTNLNVPVKEDKASLKAFIKNNFFKTYGLGMNVEPVLFRAVEVDGSKYFKFSHTYKGIPVEGIYTTLIVKDGKINRVGNGLGKINIDISRMISGDKALLSAVKFRGMKKLPKIHHVEKLITRHFGQFVPVYKVRFAPVALYDSRYVVVNALTGKIIKSGNSTYFADADTEVSDDDPVDPVEATDMTKMWKYNPVVTPKLEEVELIWVASADDAGLEEEARGFLTTDLDDQDIRKIKSFNCPDKGEKVNLQEMIGFPIEVPMCSPVQLANKIDKGSFLYDDCEGGHEFVKENMTEEKIDRCAEISMYYHASKIYKYLRGLYKDLGREGKFYLQNNDSERPLNVIGNFQMPDTSDLAALMNGGGELVPMDNAFFSQDNPTFGALLGQFGIKGDLLVFGQGTKADLGYDGDVVYHEFGHATIYTAGIAGMEFTDKYGLSNEPGSIHEGIADTFAFLMTDNSCTGEYASQGFIDYAESMGGTIEMDKEGEYYCMRTALNKYTVFEDFIGEVHWDGQPLLAANWEIYQLMKGDDTDTQEHRDNLTKLIMKTLYSIGDSDASFKLWADTFMAEVEKDDVFKGKKAEIEKILTDRNFFEEIRARSANDTIKESHIGAAAGSGDDPMGGMAGGGGITITEGDEEINVSPSYLQFYYDVPEDAEKSGIKISMSVSPSSGSSMLPTGGDGDPEIQIFYRKGSPVEYIYDTESETVTVEKDGTVENIGSISANFEIANVEKGARYYFQAVNTASTAGILKSVKVVGEDVVAETEDSDDENADSGNAADLPDDENAGSGSSSGCSLTF